MLVMQRPRGVCMMFPVRNNISVLPTSECAGYHHYFYCPNVHDGIKPAIGPGALHANPNPSDGIFNITRRVAVGGGFNTILRRLPDLYQRSGVVTPVR